MADLAERLVLLFARAPVPGRVKSRLARTEGAAEAARIYRLLAEDVHDAVMGLQRRGEADVVLCAADEVETTAAWLHGTRHVWPQDGCDLGGRMRAAFDRAFASGAARVALLGTDLVGVTPDTLCNAFRTLDDADAALAPTPDGGYGLIALRRPAPTLFEDVPWGERRVAAVTRRRAKEAGLVLADLPPVRDVDVAADLEGALPLVSVLVPVLDEAERLGPMLEALLAQVASHAHEVDVWVVDGGSADGSARVAEAHGVHVIEAPRGRGRQLRAAAGAARGRWLWILHADSRLLPGTLDRVLAFARRRARPWAFLEMRIAAASRFRSIALMNRLRARLLRLPYGDQAVLLRRAVLDRVGGVPAVPLMEDVEIARRMRRYGPPAFLGDGIEVDARRWRRYGPWGATARNLWTLFRYLALRTDPGRLASTYRRE
ncbi:MAG: TIGR04283 family arsenosugar biosynthesis glycosyltransferase [Planctomycetota bacterium]|jgi:rSAM/selenodomain-associated transferase 2/rSAM/selenodomain-associated transferase 1